MKVKAHGKLDPETGVDVSAVAYLEFERGIQGVFDCSFEASFRQEYEIVGTRGRIQVPRAFRPDVNGGNGLVTVETNGQQRTEKVEGDIYLLEVDHLSEAILEKKSLIYPAEETIANMHVIDACYASLEKKEEVTI